MKTEAERQLAKLVGMPTISDDILANDLALDYIEAYLSERGMHTRRDRFKGHGTLLASTRANNILTPTVMLTAHVDVVGGEEELFSLREEDGKLLGRGVFDMKFSIAGYLQVVNDLRNTLSSYDFGIMITCDEETTDAGVGGLISSGVRPKVCILPDSTAPGWDIETTAKGVWRVDLIAQGTTAHGGRPWEGESASLKLIHALHDLKTYFEGQGPASDSLNIGKIHGGDAYNVVPSEMIAGIDIRFLNKERLLENKKLITALCKKHGLTHREILQGQVTTTDLTHPLVKAYLESVETVTGKRPKDFISSAASDAPYFKKIGVNSIISCCEGGGHHTKNEWINRKSFLQFVPILHEYLSNTAKLPILQTSGAQAALVT